MAARAAMSALLVTAFVASAAAIATPTCAGAQGRDALAHCLMSSSAQVPDSGAIRAQGRVLAHPQGLADAAFPPLPT